MPIVMPMMTSDDIPLPEDMVVFCVKIWVVCSSGNNCPDIVDGYATEGVRPVTETMWKSLKLGEEASAIQLGIKNELL